MKQYTLTLNEQQAEVLCQALDLFTRIGLGQFENVIDVFDRGAKRSVEDREAARRFIEDAKYALGFTANASFGLRNERVEDVFRVAYDVNQVVQHRLAWDRNPEGGPQVWYRTPDRTSKQDLPTIEKK